MAELKKNQLNQILFTMVDKTDFASIESGLDAVDINAKYWGVAQGGSAASASATVSKAVSDVTSGVFKLILKANETSAYDQMLLRLSSTSTVSAAIQILTFQLVDNDDSDLMRVLTLNRSDLSDLISRVTKKVATDSQLSDVWSDLRSQTSTVGGASASQVADKVWSDFGSKVGPALSNFVSNVSDALSNLLSRVTKEVASKSLVSDVRSDLRSQTSTVGGATASQVADKVWSDFTSKVGGTSVSNFYSYLSDQLSNLTSRVTKEVASKSLLSDVRSDLRSQTSTVGGASASQVADKVWSDFQSKVGPTISNFVSNVSDALSNLVSRVPKEVASKSLLSDVHSDLRSQMSTVGGASASQVADKVWSDFTSKVGGTSVSNFYSYLSDQLSNLTSRVTKEVASKSLLSDVWSDLRSQTSTVGGASASQVADKVWSDYQSKVGASPSQVVSQFSAILSDLNSRVIAVVATSDQLSKVQSDLRSQTSTVGGASASQVADKVWSDFASKVGPTISNFVSNTSDALSNLISRVPKEVASKSLLSDVRSDLRSQTSTVGGATASQVADKVWSDFTSKVGGTSVSNFYSYLSDQLSNLTSRVVK
jgi:ribosomal protein L20A (L18A)